MYLASQIVVIIADIIFVTSLQLKNRKTLLFLQIFASSLFALQYLLLFAWVGFACALVEVLRIVVFYFLDKKQNQKHYIIASVALTALLIVTTIIGWEAWYSIIPFIGVVSVNIALAQKNLFVLKCSYTLQTICYTIYMFLIAAYIGAGLEVAVMLGGFVATFVEYNRSKKRKEKNNLNRSSEDSLKNNENNNDKI